MGLRRGAVENMDMSCCFGGTYKDKRVLVTGHTGFKGSWLAIWLKYLGAEVLGVSLAPRHKLGSFCVTNLGTRIRSAYQDLRDFKELDVIVKEFKPQVVFHLAAQSLVPSAYEYPRTTFETNVVGTLNVLETIRHCEDVRAGILITSDKCYRNIEQIWGYKENDLLGGDDPYSASKACAEFVINSYAKCYFAKDGPIVASTRAGNVIGGGDWAENRLVPDCFRSLCSGKPVEVRNPGSTRPWQYVLEPLSGYLLLGQKLMLGLREFSGGWNFGPPMGEVHTVLDVARAIIEYWGSGEVVVSTGQDFHESCLLQLDCTKARTRLDWTPTLRFEECIGFTADWYKYLSDHPEADMYDFCLGQISRYQEIALERKRSWIGGS